MILAKRREGFEAVRAERMTTTEQTATSRIKTLRRRVLSLMGRHFRRTVSRKTKFVRNLEVPNELASRQSLVYFRIARHWGTRRFLESSCWATVPSRTCGVGSQMQSSRT